MLRGVYTSASGMMVQAERQNVISNNLANVDTKGFKKDQTVVQAFPEFDIYRKDDEKIVTPFENTSLITKIGKLGTGASIQDVYTEHTQGRLEKTDNKLDFAISGEGYFTVETPTGVKLSRDGAFALDGDGYIVTHNGDKVLGQSSDGRFGYIKPRYNSQVQSGRRMELFDVDIIGDVKVGNLTPAKLSNNGFAIVAVGDKENLVKQGQNYYSMNDAKKLSMSNNTNIEQGYVEGSTVSAVKEMVEMIECSRSYETNQKVLTSQDEVLAKVVSEVGKWG